MSYLSSDKEAALERVRFLVGELHATTEFPYEDCPLLASKLREIEIFASRLETAARLLRETLSDGGRHA